MLEIIFILMVPMCFVVAGYVSSVKYYNKSIGTKQEELAKAKVSEVKMMLISTFVLAFGVVVAVNV